MRTGTTQEAELLREEMNVGDFIVFDKVEAIHSNNPFDNMTNISGTIVEKHAHTFLLDNGHSYQWKEYLIGRVI